MKLKIGIVCYPSIGGSGILATELGRNLAKKGHDIHFITYEIPFRLNLEESNIYFHQVEIYQYDLFKYPDYALNLAVKIAEISKKYDLDLLHVHYAIPHATSAYLAKQILGTRRPFVVTTLHGTDITLVGKDPAYFEIVKMSIEKSDAITAVSKNLALQTRENFHTKKSIDVIYNFFTPRIEYQNKKPLKDQFAKGDEKLLLHSSNYRKVKRTQDVLSIFMQVRQSLPCKLLFLGSGPDLSQLQQVVKQSKYKNDVHFIGSNRFVDSYISSADLFLLPSEQESFGLSALEAMSYGVPVVATQVGGLPELIEQGRSGYLTNVGDTTKMADFSIKLLSNPTLYRKISEAAKSRAKEYFSESVIVPKYEALYHRVLTG